MKKGIVLLFLLFSFIVSFSQSAEFVAAQAAANAYIRSSNLRLDNDRNVVTDGTGTIHIFLYEDGNLLVKGIPTTATEKDKFQVHLYVKSNNADNYLVEYTGKYEPSFNVQGTNPSALGVAGNGVVLPPQRIDFAIAGPYTGTLTITLKHLSGGNYNALLSSTIKIAKTIHVSIGAGPVYTSLKNPSGIKTVILANGGNTLVADDYNGRALLAVMATFYPFGKNDLMLPSWSLKDRFGILLGTAIANGTSQFSDAFFGLQYDFAIGGSIVGGLHYGRVQKVSGVNLNDFSFGTTEFQGDIETKKYMRWDLGFFIGVQVDSRVFGQIFK